MGSRRVQDTHVTIAAPIPEPMMDPRAPGDVRFLVGEDGDSTIGRFVGEERQHDLPHLPNSRSPVPCCSGPQLEVHEDYQEDLEYESSDSDEAGLGCLGGWVGFGKLDATVGNSRSLHCLSRWDAGGGSPPWCRARHWRWKKKHHLFFFGSFLKCLLSEGQKRTKWLACKKISYLKIFKGRRNKQQQQENGLQLQASIFDTSQPDTSLSMTELWTC